MTENRQITEVSDGPYGDSFRAALKKTVDGEQTGPPPEQIARLLYRIVNQRNPRLRYTVGAPVERGAVWLKRLLPYSMLEYAMSTYYGLGG
jgi:hypothetical protein